MLTRNGRGSSDKNTRTIEIEWDTRYPLAFFADGKHVLSGTKKGYIRRWRLKDGKEVGVPMKAGNRISSLAVSQDGKWIVSGIEDGRLIVWNPESHKKVNEFTAHQSVVNAVDVSPDGTKIASGSNDWTACVWSLSTGQRLLGPWELDSWVAAAKFSPDGQIIATATWSYFGISVRLYDGRSGCLLLDLRPIEVSGISNQSLAWTNDSKQLFVLSHDMHVHCLDVASRTLEKWAQDSDYKATPEGCIASNGMFIAVFDKSSSSILLWNMTTHEQIAPLIHHPDRVHYIYITADDIIVAGGNKITICSLPCRYRNDEASLKENIVHLENVVQQLQCAVGQKDDIIKSLRAQEAISNERITDLEKELTDSRLKADVIIRAHEQKHECETLYAEGRIIDAATFLLELTNNPTKHVRDNKLLMDWLSLFMNRCISTLEVNGDRASTASRYGDALVAYATALMLGPPSPETLLIKWSRMVLSCDSAIEALSAAAKFKVPQFIVYRTICDALEETDQITEAIECLGQIKSELAGDTQMCAERAAWENDFRSRCIQKLEKLGDVAMDAGEHATAIEHYSDLLSLGTTSTGNIFIKRSRAQAATSSWEEALIDADKAIELEPSSHKGYERKYAALLGMGRHSEAFKAFETMLAKLKQSPDPAIRELRRQYFDATPTIRKVVQQTIQDLPRVLIETATGRLYDKAQQAAAFEELLVYDELRSSMTTELDHERIETEVKKFYRYVMFSHRWEPHEPTFQDVEKTSVYELPMSPGSNKLKKFCELVQTLDFVWAWSDTCCINQLDKGVQQESLVAMFRWYRGSSLTIIHLLGVFSKSQKFGCLWKSIWNTRGWTYQEYLASMVVQFYTEDWKPYLNLDLFNHKESPKILSEMEGAMNFASQELASLCPGFDKVREKLYLASARETTREEDIAYSLYGIFNVTLPVVYGEGKQAVGRLLEHILTRSDNVSLLAWTGRSGTQHSYLPLDLTVYNKVVPPHVPSLFEAAEMDNMVMMLHSSFPNSSSVVTLYDRLCDLPPLILVAGRLRLSGIVFPVTNLVPLLESDTGSKHRVYHVTTAMLGDIEIKTMDRSFGTEGLLLIHPWIGSLVDPDFVHAVPQFDCATRALRLVARLRQPFGALLLAPLGRVQHRRVATDCLIMAQVREDASLSGLIDGIRTVDIQ